MSSRRVLRAAAAASSSAAAATSGATTMSVSSPAKAIASTSNKKRKAEGSSTATASKPKKSSSSPKSGSSNKTLPHAKLMTLSSVVRDRLNPKLRGIHEDALQVGIAPTSASTCVDCGRSISKGEMRWGIKYGGNPLPLPVVPLYGHMPMVMWCHGPSSSSSSTSAKSTAGGGFCGLALVRLQDKNKDPTSASWLCDAARTCHICSNAPDDTSNTNNLRVLCGGKIGEHGKIREHAFHLRCWKLCLMMGSAHFNQEQRQLLQEAMDHPETKWTRHSKSSTIFDEILTYQDLTEEEKAVIQRELGL